jgi:hypothetical protein
MLKYIFTIVLCLISILTKAQTWPAENALLNYRLIGFTIPVKKDIAAYQLEISNGTNNNEVYFNKNKILSITSPGNHITATVPAFSASYTWRIIYLNKNNKPKGETKFYHFSTGRINYVDTSMYRVKVIDTATKHKDMYVFLDCFRALVDMNGAPLWYLPDLPGDVDTNTSVRDMKITQQGTITFLAGNYAYEIDYNGKVLWPSKRYADNNDTSEYYHHEFTRLSNGHYMVAGHETEDREIPFDPGPINSENERIEKNGDKYFIKVRHGTIMEYDSAKNIIWSWNSKNYFTDQDLFSRKAFKGVLTPNLHYNAFYFSEKDSIIYASFKNINRVVKISYPSGKVITEYGEVRNKQYLANSPFYGQHNCRLTSDGYLSLFNNNISMNIVEKRPGKRNTSSVMLFKEPKTENDTLEIAWQFPCIIDTFAASSATGGGTVFELPDHSFIVSMGTTNRDFIVSRDKKILWNVITQFTINSAWAAMPNYRLSVITNKEELSRLLFHK